ncbi:LVIVD repeat-containing protein [Nitriliruptor alkaliphilus]|uniref:LVIVD repeat-containing protein n=1 Tax=Nitriliruptor alkaliphilus TaxID=427918 RepID=UPI0012ED4F9A|nr:hypothetical protein [Nitriliruptor alkaliphilus]
MNHRVRTVLAAAAAVTVAAATGAIAHPGHGERGSVDFGDIADDGGKQHDGEGGHLDPVSYGVRLIGKGALSAPPGTNGDMTGRVADVAAHGVHAYLTAFRAADCLGGGAWIMDISDPTAPVEVGFLPTTDGNYAGEGAQVVTPDYGAYAGRQLFIHQNETCDAELAEATGKERYLGGINIWDVTDPLDPQLLVEHAGDMTVGVDADGNQVLRDNPTTVHSAFAWNSHLDEKTYAVLVDNEEWEDVDIFDITDPTDPAPVNDTLDLWTLFDVAQSSPPNLTQVFNHDMMVYRKGDRYIMNVNYWDGGYVLLDVTDPTPGNVTLIAESDYAELDEERLKRGHEVAPEGNAHQSEFSPDFKYLIGTDEDFSPYGVGEFSITTGPNAGVYESVAVGGAAPVASLPDLRLNGPTAYVGYACPDSAPVPPRDEVGLPELAEGEEAIAVIQRGPVGDPSAPEGACFPGQKADAAMAAGYDAVLFVDHHAGHNASPDQPFCGSGAFTQPVVAVCTTHTAFHHLFDSPPDYSMPYDAAKEPAIGDVGHSIDVDSVFNGWGYVRQFRTKFSDVPGTPGSIEQIDTYAVEEAQMEEYAIGYGDLSVHEVATDPRPGVNLAYLSYYAAGLRIVSYGPKGMQEVAAFIDEGGNNFWGIEVHEIDGETYVLASDRDHGLYIFQADVDVPGRPTSTPNNGPKDGKGPKDG